MAELFQWPHKSISTFETLVHVSSGGLEYSADVLGCGERPPRLKVPPRMLGCAVAVVAEPSRRSAPFDSALAIGAAGPR